MQLCREREAFLGFLEFPSDAKDTRIQDQPNNQMPMPLAPLARMALIVTGLLTAWGHVQLAATGFAIHVDNGKGAGFLLASLTGQPLVAMKLLGQLAVVLILYLLFFWLIAILSRQRRLPSHWAENDAVLIFATWASLAWLILRLHSIWFPHSVWTWAMLLLQDQAQSYLLDIASGCFLFWRALIVLRVWTSAILKCVRQSGVKYLALGGVASGAIITLLIIAQAPGAAQMGVPTEADKKAKRNVIIIGLDSLRRDVLLSADLSAMPNLAALRDRSYVNSQVITPIARTFPAWVSILTGLGPAKSGARTNHAPQKDVRRDLSIAWEFSNVGYRTIYATDETRFSHIGPEFGFDTVVGPQKGITDFLLGQFGDQPLVNLFVQVPFAELVLPALVGNRAFAHAYRPSVFVNRLERSIGPADSRPTFLAAHLCVAHWPFYVANTKSSIFGRQFVDERYEAMLVELDAQFGILMKMLERQGYLNDETLVVVLADHGEGLPGRSELAQVMWADESIGESSSRSGGHGATLRDPAQWQVFAMISGGSVFGKVPARINHSLASLEDIAPTLRRLAGLQEIGGDRQESNSDPAQLGARDHVRIETGWRPRGFSAANPTGSAALRIAEQSYLITADGRVELKQSVYEAALANKNLGVTDGDEAIAIMRVRDELFVTVRQVNRPNWLAYRPADRRPESLNESLLSAACLWPEFRAMIENWCE